MKTKSSCCISKEIYFKKAYSIGSLQKFRFKISTNREHCVYIDHEECTQSHIYMYTCECVHTCMHFNIHN